MSASLETNQFYGSERIGRILLRVAPPVMLAQMIQAVYAIVDGLMVGRAGAVGLNALSIIYPMQLMMTALAVGMGVGLNTAMAARLGRDDLRGAQEMAGVGTPLALGVWMIFALICWLLMPAYAAISTNSAEVARQAVIYGRIISVASLGYFMESMWSKILQAEGDMRMPMIAQIAGALVSIALDVILILGLFGFPRLGIVGAAIGYSAGQSAAALIVMRRGIRKRPALSEFRPCIAAVFRLGLPNILMQAGYAFYILGFNLILVSFSDQAVTALGIYYKWLNFFFIPIGAMQVCIVPIASFNYAARNIERCKKILLTVVGVTMAMMAVGTLFFECIPDPMLRAFTSDAEVIRIGTTAFRIIGPCFIPMASALIIPAFLQAVGFGVRSTMLSFLREIVLLVPLGYLFSRFGLAFFWLTYPVSETISTIAGIIFYRQFLNHPYVRDAA